MKRILSAACFLALAACGSDGGSDSANGGSEAGGATSAGVNMEPGQWEMTSQILSMEVPGMPAGTQMPTPPATTISMCLTPEQAATPNAGFLTGAGENSGCRTEGMNFANGRVSGTVICEMEGTRMRSTVDGQFGSTNYEISQRAETEANGMTTRMEVRTTGRRIGECTT